MRLGGGARRLHHKEVIMKSFICELEKNNKIHKAIVKAETQEQAINDLSLNWTVLSIKEK